MATKAKRIADPVTVQDAVNIFDLAATRTHENHQTKAWKILRAELERLSQYEQVAGLLAIEKADLRRKSEAAA